MMIFCSCSNPEVGPSTTVQEYRCKNGPLGDGQNCVAVGNFEYSRSMLEHCHNLQSAEMGQIFKVKKGGLLKLVNPS